MYAAMVSIKKGIEMRSPQAYMVIRASGDVKMISASSVSQKFHQEIRKGQIEDRQSRSTNDLRVQSSFSD